MQGCGKAMFSLCVNLFMVPFYYCLSYFRNKPHFFVFTNLGNCWFISAAAELVTKPVLFGKVVPPNQSFRENYAGNLNDSSFLVTLRKKSYR